MKPLGIKNEPMIFINNLSIFSGNEVLPPNRYTGAATPGMPESTAFHSKRSYGYAFRSKAALSGIPDIASSGILMQHPD